MIGGLKQGTDHLFLGGAVCDDPRVWISDRRMDFSCACSIAEGMSLPFQDTLNTVYKKRPELASDWAP